MSIKTSLFPYYWYFADAFTVDMEEMEQAINDKTKVILLNTPHNPTGKVFTESELESFAELLERHPQVVGT